MLNIYQVCLYTHHNICLLTDGQGLSYPLWNLQMLNWGVPPLKNSLQRSKRQSYQSKGIVAKCHIGSDVYKIQGDSDSHSAISYSFKILAKHILAHARTHTTHTHSF